MKRILLTATILALGAGTTGVSFAAGGGPGPFGPNNWGLCNAWAHNNDHAHSAPPFAALQAAADEANQSVEDWCAANGQKPGGK